MAVPTNSTRNFITMQQKYDRVVLLVDMDCFYCQVEEKLNPELKGKPVAVVQYNAWRGGGIIAVNYAARAKGVTRHMRGDEAKEQCPEIELVKVPNVREKADLSKYRDAGKDVANVLQKFTTLLERASVDEAYLDITEAVNKRLSEMNAGTFTLQPQELIDTYAVGYERFGDYLKAITTHFSNPYCDDELLNKIYDQTDLPAVRQSDVRLLLGASIASEIRAAVKAATSYECSAGIAHNKIIAKLACGMNKPNKQTIMPLNQIAQLFETLPLGKIKGLGGKFGEEVCERLKIKTLGQVLKFTENELQKKFDEKNGTWLFYISRGIDLEAVTPRFYSKSIGCCKKFPGRNNITGLNTLKHWLNELATEIAERLEKDIMENNRKAKQMTVSYIQELDGEECSSSRSVPLNNYEQESLAQRSLEVIKANTKQFIQTGSEAILNNPIKFLGISVGKFETIDSGQSSLQQLFANQALKKRKIDEQPKENKNQATNSLETAQSEQPVQQQSALKRLLEQQAKKQQTLESNAEEFDAIESEMATTCEKSIEKATKKPIESFLMKALQNSKKAVATINKNADTTANTNSDSSSNISHNNKANAIESINIDFNSLNADSNGSPTPKRLKLNETVTEIESMTNNANETFYQTEYAEYALPELRLDLLEFKKCEICGVKVPLEERALQMHQDHHFALELSQQLRVEFRNETINGSNKQEKTTKNNNINNKSNNKNQTTKKQTTPTPANAAISITKFLRPKELTTTTALNIESSMQEQPTTSKAVTATTVAECAPTIECEKCNRIVKQFEWNEHLDYHIAKELQVELNKQVIQTVKIAKKPSTTTTTKQNQNKSVAKPISQFFLTNSNDVEK